MKVRTMALIQELGVCNLNSREEFETLRKFFKDEELKDKYLEEEIELTRKMMPPEYAEQLIELRLSIAHDYDVRRAAMYLKLLRYSYASSGKSFASQPFDIRKLFPLIQQAGRRLSDVVIENQDFETLIRHYDREDTFFYIDPPYYFTEGMYEGFGEEDHLRLFEVLRTIKGFCLISYNDCFETRDIYKDYNIFAFSRPHSMAQRYEAGKEFKEFMDFKKERLTWHKHTEITIRETIRISRHGNRTLRLSARKLTVSLTATAIPELTPASMSQVR